MQINSHVVSNQADNVFFYLQQVNNSYKKYSCEHFEIFMVWSIRRESKALSIQAFVIFLVVLLEKNEGFVLLECIISPQGELQKMEQFNLLSKCPIWRILCYIFLL